MGKALDLARALVTVLEKEENKNKVKLSDIPAGGKFTTDIGKFIVLEQCGDCTKVITEELYRENVRFDDGTRNYAESKLRKLCDGEIYDEFEAVFGNENFLSHVIFFESVDLQHEFGSIRCKVRPITFYETIKYNDFLVNKKLTDWYWTCTPWSTEERGWPYSIAVVTPLGSVSSDSYDDLNGVRPVCILKSNIFVSKAEELLKY